jgi:hypothetical protein
MTQTGKDDTPGALLPPSLPAPPSQAHLTEDERESLKIAVTTGVHAAPVILIHLGIIYLFVSAQTGFHMPAWLGSRLLGWAWINGGLVATLVWGWRRRGLPFDAKLWLRGGRAVALGALWLLLSIVWIVYPGLARVL